MSLGRRECLLPKRAHLSRRYTSRRQKNFGFRLAFVSPSSSSSLSSSPSSLPSSSPRLVLFCFAGAQPSKGELLSWCDTSQVTSLVSYAIADRRQLLNPLRIWRCPHSFWLPHLSSCTPSQVTYIDNVSSLVPCQYSYLLYPRFPFEKPFLTLFQSSIEIDNTNHPYTSTYLRAFQANSKIRRKEVDI